MPGRGSEPTAHAWRWLMLAGASAIYACFGALMAAMSVLVTPVSTELSLSSLQMGVVLGLWQFVYLFVAIPAGILLDRFGLRLALLAAGLLIALSSGLRVVVDSYAGLLATVALFGLGGPLVSVGAPKLVSRWFAGAERGLAMGIFMSSTAIGALLATIGTNSVIMPIVGNDWRGVFGIYAVVTAAAVAAWATIASRPVSRLGDAEADAPGDDGKRSPLRDLLRQSDVRLAMAMAVTMFFFVHSMNAWLPEILRGNGLDIVNASYWSGLPTVIAVIATLVITRLALPHRRVPILTGVAVVALVSATLLEIEPVVVLALCLLGLGIARSCLVPVALLLLMEAKATTTRSVGTASGLFFAAGQVGGMLGPVLCGLAIDVSGDYDAPLWLMNASMIVLLGLIFTLERARRPARALHSDTDPASGR